MQIDMQQFQATYLAEADENLADLEQGILQLERGESADLNAIFRAAHSMKGGAGTFGFTDIASYTHHLETVLDLARDSKLAITKDLVNAMLAAVDILTKLLDCARNNQPTPASLTAASIQQLQSLLGSTETTQNTSRKITISEKRQTTFHLEILPAPNLAATGTDPITLLKELHSLGEVTDFSADTSALPPLADMEPEAFYIRWQMNLTGNITEADIRDVFMFVPDEVKLTITPQASETTSTTITLHPASTTTEHAKPTPEGQSYLRVATEKVDVLINLVGELVTSNAMVNQFSSNQSQTDNQAFQSALHEMGQHTRNLQEAIMAIRMMPISFVFSRFPRLVRDTAEKLGKNIHLITIGEQIELDKSVIEKITDPLTHLVRNAIDHAIETPEERHKSGKPQQGTVELAAFHKGGNVIVEIRDDGRGLDRQKIINKAIEKGLVDATTTASLTDSEVWEFIFLPGFSTAAKVTDVSGRGVGMDVVRRNVKNLGGQIYIRSTAGQGTTIGISLPLTLAIVDGMATRVDDTIYILPLLNIIESIRPADANIQSLKQNLHVINVRGEYLPLLPLAQVLDVPNQQVPKPDEGIVIIVESEHHKLGLQVSDLLGERQVVIKSLESNYERVRGISGATILGDGKVSLIIDLLGLIQLAKEQGHFTHDSQPA